MLTKAFAPTFNQIGNVVEDMCWSICAKHVVDEVFPCSLVGFGFTTVLLDELVVIGHLT